jgi:hypothetical protein
VFPVWTEHRDIVHIYIYDGNGVDRIESRYYFPTVAIVGRAMYDDALSKSRLYILFSMCHTSARELRHIRIVPEISDYPPRT